ncbi:MAG: DUF2071 domain-containing protein [Terracidiphilus sp.]|jgi:uncharacterized protein YqjF (DUF2071 family)
MKDQKIFLTAEWKDILMLNYAIDPRLLEPFVPRGTELDDFDGVTYLSLVGFKFKRTCLLGLPVPLHQCFEEVNVRFYVRRASKRGVVFIRELVPKHAVAAVARIVFNEKYSYAPMSHRVEARAKENVVEAEYSWGSGRDRSMMRIETEGKSYIAPEGSATQFITEHYWGYAAQRDGGCLEYEVRHPQWNVTNAKEAGCSGNAAAFYGSDIAECLMRNPDSAFLAEGSQVTVFRGTRIS